MTATAERTAGLDDALAHASRLLAHDPALAAEQARAILAAVPGHPQAELLLASAHRLRGDTGAALAVLRPLAARQPRAARVHFELGLALAQAGEPANAATALRRAVELRPTLPQAWRLLGDQLAAAGESELAGRAYTSHVRHSTQDPRLLEIANALQGEDLARAQSLLRDHLAQAPTDVAALRMAAELASRLGRQEDAENLLERCLALAPGFRAARQNYALVLHRGNQPVRALEQIERLLAKDPGDPNARNLKAVVLCRIGDYAQAIRIYDDLLADHPAQPKLWLSLGHALKTHGDTTRAIEAYRRSAALDPAGGEAWWSLANLKTFRFEDADLAAMRAALARPGLPEAEALQLHFALGKALEDRGDYEAAFRHYAEGNERRRAELGYRADDTTARVARIERTYTRDFFADRAGAGAPDADPIFVVGLPRAGSTLIEQILSSHSQVEGTMELPEVISITRELRAASGEARNYHAALAALAPAQLRELGQRYLDNTRIHRKAGAPFFIDKMPNNFLHVGLIHLMLPNARIIDARRHPLACCFSGFKQHFARGQAFSYSLDDLGRYYRDYVRLMAHFDAVLPGRVHRVFYESMVDDTEAEVRRLLDYCGLPFEEGCLRFFENKRPVRTASSEQVRQPIYRDGVDHWRHFEPWLEPLKQALGPVLAAYPAVPAFD